MIKTIKGRLDREQYVDGTLSCSQEDIVNRVGIMDLKEEKELMEKAGRTFNDYVSKVYNRVIGKGKNQKLEYGLNTMMFKENMDITDYAKFLDKEIKDNKEKLKNLNEESIKIKEKLEKINKEEVKTDTNQNKDKA